MLIELFGDYWHTKRARETADERIDHFRKYGLETLVVWQKEMNDTDALVERIKQFVGQA